MGRAARLVEMAGALRERPPGRPGRGRGAEANCGEETGRRIPAVLDTAPPEGHANWTGPLIAEALGDVRVQYAGVSCARTRSTFPAGTRAKLASMVETGPDPKPTASPQPATVESSIVRRKWAPVGNRHDRWI